jgi:hypothetical protein
MHACIHVLGDGDPVERAMQCNPAGYEPDWAAIGGRYTGTLPPLPGARTGRVHGDAMPSLEASIMHAVREGGVGTARLTRKGPGVDQNHLRELDITRCSARRSCSTPTTFFTAPDSDRKKRRRR